MKEFRVQVSRRVTQVAEKTVKTTSASKAKIIAQHEANQLDTELNWQTELVVLPVHVTSKIVE